VTQIYFSSLMLEHTGAIIGFLERFRALERLTEVLVGRKEVWVVFARSIKIYIRRRIHLGFVRASFGLHLHVQVQLQCWRTLIGAVFHSAHAVSVDM
jgi:hypothetical protein